MKSLKRVSLTLLAAMIVQMGLAQHAKKPALSSFEAYQKKRFAETEEQHRMVHTYFSKEKVQALFNHALAKAGVVKTDEEAFRHMLDEYYCYFDRNEIYSKINRNELNDVNIGSFLEKKEEEYASYYAASFLKGKASLLGDNAPKISKVSGKEIENFLSSKIGAPVVLSANCGNSDFETGNYSGWTGGNYNPSGAFNCGGTTPNPMPSAGFGFTNMNITSDEHGLCNGGNDPSVSTGVLPCVSPFGGTISARIGDITNGCGAAEMRFQFVVTSQNTNFTYYYAAVMYDGHPANTAPKMEISMTDITTGQPIGCAAYSIDATQAANPSSGFLAADPNNPMMYYKPWSAVFVPLTAYLGKTVEVHVLTSDCNGTAHRGYAYFDVECSPFQCTLGQFPFCGGMGSTITAPAGAATYSWTSSGGTFQGATNAQTCSVTTSGTYTCTMTAYGSGCSYTIDTVVNVVINSLPVANFSSTSPCANAPMQFTDLSDPNGGPPITGWTWNFGNGQTSVNQNPSTTYSVSGTYTTSLIINAGGCTDTVQNVVTVLPTPSVTVANVGPVCSGDIVPAATFTPNPNDPNTFYQWVNSNSAIGLGTNGVGMTPSFTAGINNTLSNMQSVVTVTPTLNGCPGPPSSYTISVYPIPHTTVADVEFCPGVNTPVINFNTTPAGPTTYTWVHTNSSIGLASTGNSSNIPSFQTVNAGSTIQTSTVHVVPAVNGCPGPDSTFIININPNPTPAFIYSRACLGDPTQLTDISTVGSGSITGWAWDINNDGVFLDATNPNPFYLFSPAGPHQVGLQVTTNKGCKNSVYETIYVNYPPNPAFVGDDLEGCPVHPVNFTESSTAVAPAQVIDWSWDFGNGQVSVSQQPTTVLFYNSSPLLPITYTVSLTVQTDSGCKATLVKPNYVLVYPQPIAGFTWDPPDADILGPTIHFYNTSVGGSGVLPIKYYFGDVFIGQQDPRNWSNLTNPIYTYNDQEPYTYYVTQWVKNIYGCKDSITHPVTILPAYTFYIPNAFSPNGDGKNEGFKGTGIGIDLTTYNLWIFDRWGNEVFHSVDLEETWDGRLRGTLVQEDVYCWKVRFSDISGAKHEFHGIVSVIR